MATLHTAPCGCIVDTGDKLQPRMGIAQTCGEHALELGMLRRSPAKTRDLVRAVCVAAMVATISKSMGGKS